MAATEEQMALLATAHVSHVSYILLLYSVAFLMFLFVCMLLHLYAMHAWPAEPKPTAVVNGHAVESRRVRDAEEFELEGLMSDDDHDDDPATPKPKRGEANGRAAH